MGELYNPFPKLPKNIRQMGERDDVVKLYVEDYVNTYLKRLYPVGGQDLRVGLLLGNVENHDGTPYIFVDGALEMEDVTASGEKVIFSEAAWKKAYQSIEETFPKRTVQGWFLCGAPGCTLSPLNYWKQHGQYFGGKNQLMYLNSGIDGDESIYITSDDGFYRLKGYSVYYERNQMMQDYMILRKDVRRVESGANDRVIRDFRQRMEGRKMEAVSRRGTVRTLGTLCSVLSVAVLAGGVVMFNNYQKMREMETVLVSVLPAGITGWQDYSDKEEGGKLVVEEIKGSVYPTKAEGQTGLFKDGEGSNALPGETSGTSTGSGSLSSQGEGAGRDGGMSGKDTSAPSGQAGASGQGDQSGQAGASVQGVEGGQAGASGQGDQSGQAGASGQGGQSGQAGEAGQGNQSGQAGASGQGDQSGQAGEAGRPGASAKAGSGQNSQANASGQTGTGQSSLSQTTSSPTGTGDLSAAVSAEPEGQTGGNSTAVKDYPVTNMKPGTTYEVKDGETLYGICFELYDSLKYLEDICALNHLDDENRIIAGQQLILPDLTGIQ